MNPRGLTRRHSQRHRLNSNVGQKMKSILLLLAISLLSGCATVPVSQRPRIAPPNGENAVLYLFFEMNDPRTQYGASVWVDGRRLCKIGREQYIWTYVQPGEHRIEVKSLLYEKLLSQRTLVTESGSRHYLSVSWFVDDRPDGLVLVQALVGKADRPEFKKPMQMYFVAPELAETYTGKFFLLDEEGSTNNR